MRTSNAIEMGEYPLDKQCSLLHDLYHEPVKGTDYAHKVSDNTQTKQ